MVSKSMLKMGMVKCSPSLLLFSIYIAVSISGLS
jgi:hypothetical protein